MMSGGKDSAYLAWLLKRKYNLKMLAVTIDNNFEYEETFERAAEIARELDLPQIQYRLAPDITKLFYRFIMSEQPLKEKDFGQLCLYCGKYLLDQGIRIAESFGIPGVIAGYNPDQLFGMGRCIEVEDSTIRIWQQEAILKKIIILTKPPSMLLSAMPRSCCLFFQLPSQHARSFTLFYTFPISRLR